MIGWPLPVPGRSVVTALRRLSRARPAIVGAAVGLLVAAQLGGLDRPPSAARGAEGVDGRVIVRFRDVQAARTGRAAAANGARPVAAAADAGTQLWLVEAGREREVADRLAADPEVEYAEPDALKRPPRPTGDRVAAAAPNDPLYGIYQWNLPKVNAPQAWDVTTGDPSVTVAVIDSGFDVGHPDRPASLRLGCDYVVWGTLDYAGACPAVSGDENGHGTHVGGIVAARQNNALGISGLAPGVTLLAIRTADAGGVSYISDIASAVREATDAGARVINLSLGGPDRTITEGRAIDYALGRGVVVVAAAGNEYMEGNPTSYPAAFPGVVAVGSASDTDQHASFSNTGGYLSLVAPGGSASSSADPNPRHWIVSLFPLGRRGVPQTGYQALIGTSQATPHVAAAAGLIFSVDPRLSGAAAANLLRSTARPLGAPRPNDTFGYGYLDAQAAVLAARAGSGTAPTPSSSPTRTATPTPSRSPTPSRTPTPSPTPTPACPAAGAALCPPPTPAAARVFLPLSSRASGGGGGYPGPGR